MRVVLVRIERRAASVGWAVNTGRNSSLATTSATVSGDTPAAITRSTASPRDPP